MPQYDAPVRDIKFVRDELLHASDFFSTVPQWEEATSDLADTINEECAKFSAGVLQPLNHIGDTEGCTLSDSGVKAPSGFRDAYQQYIEGGWPAMEAPAEFGGQGLPKTLTLATTEFTGTLTGLGVCTQVYRKVPFTPYSTTVLKNKKIPFYTASYLVNGRGQCALLNRIAAAT
jgi:hypothetical protein